MASYQGVTQPGLTGQGIAHRLAQAIQFQTISHQDPTALNQGAFIGLHAYLEQAFPYVHSTLKKEVVGDYSLLYTWQGVEPTLQPILLTGHIDVMPVEAGTEDDWAYPPFNGCIAEGYVWGRGTLDDKGAVLGILESVETLIREGFKPRRTIYLAFGHDEECGGYRGAAQIAASLESRGVQLEYVLDEGLAITEGIVQNVSKPVAIVGIAEKGCVSLELSVIGEGGHSSMPPRQTAIGILAAAIAKIEAQPMKPRLGQTARKFLARLTQEMRYARKILVSKQWLFGGLILRQLSASPTGNAIIRTTAAVTMFQGGIKENILPAKAHAIVNFRILPGDSISSVIDYVRKTIRDSRIQVKNFGNVQSEPSSVSDTDSPGFKNLELAIRKVFPGVLVAPGLVLGMTDSRHYAPLTKCNYRFSPIWVRTEDLNRAHGTNERVSVKNYEEAVKFYKEVIQNS